jgi:hypothetical protein
MARYRFRLQTSMIVIAELAVVLGVLRFSLKYDDMLILPFLVAFLVAVIHVVVRFKRSTQEQGESSDRLCINASELSGEAEGV